MAERKAVGKRKPKGGGKSKRKTKAAARAKRKTITKLNAQSLAAGADSESCWFTVDVPTVSLAGAVFRSADDSKVKDIAVKGTTYQAFVVDPGKYYFEFNALPGGSKFNLKFFVHGKQTPCTPSKFDTSDDGGATDRVSRFAV